MGRLIRPRTISRSVTYYGKRKRTFKQSFPFNIFAKKNYHENSQNGIENRALEVTSSSTFSVDNVTTDQNVPSCHKGSSYSKKKIDRLKEWQSLRDTLFKTSCQSFTHSSSCDGCGEDSELYRCLDCTPWNVLCHHCLILRHQYPHLHMFEAWQNGTFIGYVEDTPVWNATHQCINNYVKEIVIIDEKGRQHVRKVQFCSCEEEPATLVRLGLWPSSPQHPRMAFHFDLLRWLLGLILECHVSVKGFCESLKARLPKHYKSYVSSEIQNIYRVLMTESFEEFKHFVFRTEKFSINENSDDGTQCAACHNMPTKVFSFDADFQLVRKASSGKSWDSSRHNSSFFLNQTDVDQFVAKYQSDSKPTNVDCSEFQAASAIRSKNKNSKLAETAVFGSTCRHGFPKYFFSLKHGERLGYSVFLLKKLLEDTSEDQTLHVMYDIACVLHSHLKKYNAQDILSKVNFSIPIFHCYGHKRSCQVLYSPRRTLGLGLTDGESVERLWSYLGKFSKITKEMTPENRVDLLTDALLHYGQKIQDKLAKSLLDKHKKAIDTESSCRTALEELLSSHEDISMEDITMWTKEEPRKVLAAKEENKEKLSPKEEYSLAIESLSAYRSNNTHIGKMDDEENDSTTRKIEQVVKRFEKRLSVQWTLEDQECQGHLTTGKEKQRRSILLLLQKDASQRILTLDLIKKYAKGQAVATRLSKQLKTLVAQMRKKIEKYNSIGEPVSNLPLTLSFDDVKDHESTVWQLLHVTQSNDTHVPFVLQSHLIDKKALLDRAIEEQGLVKNEMHAVVNWHKEQHLLVQQSCSLLDTATKSILLREGLYLERKLLYLKASFEPIIGEILVPNTFSGTVGLQLLNTSVQLFKTMQEEAAEILENLDSIDLLEEEEEEEEDVDEDIDDDESNTDNDGVNF